MALTTHGFPYPVGTDRVMDGDNVIQALAQKNDDMVTLAAATGLPRCRMIANADQVMPNNSSTKVNLQVVSYDNNGMASTGTSAIIIKTAGWYRFFARFVWASNSTGLRSNLIYRNAVDVIAETNTSPASGSPTIYLVPSEPFQCAVNDSITLIGAQTSGGGTLNLTTYASRYSSLAAELVAY